MMDKTTQDWYSGALDVLRPLGWHLAEMVALAESHNRAAKALDHLLIPEAEIRGAKKALEEANKFFHGKKRKA